MVNYLRSWFATVFGCLLFTTALQARAQVQDIGDGPSALPAVHRVGVIDTERYRLSLSGLFGYGYTESIISDEDSHHRMLGKLSIGFTPIPWLAVAYTQDIRYDRHSGTADDEDSGWIAEPRVRLRGGGEIGRVRLGGEVELWLPASDSLSNPGAGASLDFNLLAAYQAQRLPLLVAGLAGFRMDRSAEGSSNADALSLADRMSLGVSDSHAVLLGLAIQGSIGPVELLGEWTWDMHLGDEAPSIEHSPMRLTAGVRYWPHGGLQLQLLVDVATVGRPAINVQQPLIAVEPRVSVIFGLSYRIGFARAEEVEPEEPVVVAPPPEYWIRGQVVDPEDNGIAGAAVSYSSASGSGELETDEEGNFELQIDGPGEGTLSVEAENWQVNTETVVVGASGGERELFLRVALEPIAGRVYGTINNDGEMAVSGARVRAAGGDVELEALTDEDGHFSINGLSDGPVEITITASGHLPASTQVVLELGETTEIVMALEQLAEEGQLVGTVRALNGTPLTATIMMEPIDLELRTTRQGLFELNLAPRRYRVHISAEGYTSQRRIVVIEQNGVTMLNIDLRPARRRR